MLKSMTPAVDVDEVIRTRKTVKVLRDPSRCDGLPAPMRLRFQETLKELIELAGWAPFHKVAHPGAHRRGPMTSVVPWRFYVLDKPACCRLLRHLEAQAEAHPDSRWGKAWGSKIPALLAGTGALVQVTWLPDPAKDGAPDEAPPALTPNNVEHVAAASAAIQNLLLAAEARGLLTYWSSGGILRTPEVFRYLGIPDNQMLLGSVFIAHPEQPCDDRKPGGLRERRGTPADWSIWVTPG